MKKYLVIGAVILSFALGAWLFRGNSKIAYWKGRSEQVTQELHQAEEKFEEAMKVDKEVQEEKDLRIAELEKEVAKDDVRIVIKEKELVVTRDMLIASGLYQGLVKELDEKWAEKYAALESKLASREAQIEEWKEKFNSKVNLAIKAYVDKDLQQREAIKVLQKRAVNAERQVKSLSFKGKLWKWAAILGGAKITYDVIKGRT